jgi:anti-anti-sigma factor
VHDDAAGLDQALRAFLAGGLDRGERLLCVGDRVIEGVRGAAAPLDRVDELVEAGTLQLLTVAEVCAATGAFDTDLQFAFYDAATRRALGDGYTGLRVVAEVSPLAADPELRRELVRWEQRADEYIAHGPGMTAMCAYRADLPPEALADATSVHPLGHTPDGVPQFRIFFDDHRVVLSGSVDTFDADRLARVLAVSPTPPEVVLDLGLVEFVDVAGFRVLARWAGGLRARSVPVRIEGASPIVRRIWRLLAFDDVASASASGGRSAR